MKKTPEYQRVLAKAKDVRLLLLDVDGVLTDGKLFYTDQQSEGKAFNTQDGFGLRLLVEGEIDTGLITARTSAVVARRAEELQMSHIYQGIGNKNKALKAILQHSGYKPFEVAYMGDDWLDLCLLSRVGLALAPSNAVKEVKEAVHYVTERAGGGGAVRDACDLLIEAKGLDQQLLQRYTIR
ncbi:MAG: 3-deoxy-D-manno-octulosonate 8-phosphate phosphatase [Deltaproteobacteria bacterium]|nr:MAG: 3-deoxy-D-manno-octulosonate 8-phosphate phosphatase [Deltaproteobacteria bacterium]